MQRRKSVLLLTALWALTGCERFTAARLSGGGTAKVDSAMASFAADDVDLTDDATSVTTELITGSSAYESPTPTLHWTPVDGASRYELDVDDSEQCLSPLMSYSLNSTAQKISYLANGVYQACLKAFRPSGELVASGSGHFRIAVRDAADPLLQNGVGGHGGALGPETSAPALLLFQDDATGKLANRGRAQPVRDGVADLSDFGIYADPAAQDRLKLIVNDSGNHRVLIFDSLPTRGDDVPRIVLGQEDFDTGQAGLGATGFVQNRSASLCTDGKLMVTDEGGNRILVWKTVPHDNQAPADFVIGQSDFLGIAPGQGAKGLNHPSAAYCMENKLVVVDRGNNRLLVYNHIPTQSAAAADFAIGQPDLAANGSGCAADQLDHPSSAILFKDQLVVADTGNHRILLFDVLPNTLRVKARTALGQSSLSRCTLDTLTPVSLAAREQTILVGGDERGTPLIAFTWPAQHNLKTEPPLATIVPLPSDLGSSRGPAGLVSDGRVLWWGDRPNHRLVTIPWTPF